jgi:hypothetical protein
MEKEDRSQSKVFLYLNSYFKFIDVNMRHTKHFRMELGDYKQEKTNFIAYGVTFENMRKLLKFRAPYTINNLTNFNYKLKLIRDPYEQP